ncbi:uroporphyrinogen-III synthase [Sinisalibacter lacisalsi]|uniref:Uroporphyrinogen III methyltransferase n=1 Tax=Sinisalibacter lacisalsi TaxID=1526570 RepID=A0ABQ1QBM5_9RHOB|nr:uroporphyrinogen-III synthase [Sinisalibacter lacisalsi]GGD21072.1 uroporphyrinogen III methyltransferase [Sinisalibacter lacisalsi]
MTATLLLTRPEAQSRAFSKPFEDVADLVIAPVMDIVGTGALPALTEYRGVILTSANALRFVPRLQGVPAWCVGARTAEAARAHGADIMRVADDAESLLTGFDGAGPLLHIRGEHARGNVAERLTSSGIETHEVVIYRQEERKLTDRARALIQGEDEVILPLFSPRSAALVGSQVVRVGPGLVVIAMSPAVAEAWHEATGAEAVEVCARPTSEEMRNRVARRLRG